MMVELMELLLEKAEIYFVEDYLEKAEDFDIAAQSLGIYLSKMLDFDGEVVALFLITALYAGLEDSNWHTEAGVFYDWMNEMKEGSLLCVAMQRFKQED